MMTVEGGRRGPGMRWDGWGKKALQGIPNSVVAVGTPSPAPLSPEQTKVAAAAVERRGWEEEEAKRVLVPPSGGR
jgi:hypothetical protein